MRLCTKCGKELKFGGCKCLPLPKKVCSKKKYSESYYRVMKYKRKKRPMELIKKIEKDLAELKELLINP